jgi:SAM-dependent methyltransferase
MAEILQQNRRAAEVWNSGGADYDRLSRAMADSIEHCVARLDPRPGERILDLATGTGWTARQVARKGAAVVGVDIAEEAIAVARQLAAAEGLAIDFRVGPAEKLPFADAAFDGVISTCGVIFSNEPARAAAELARVTRKGGRIAFTAWRPGSTIVKMFQILGRYGRPSAGGAAALDWARPKRVKAFLGGSFDLAFEEGVSFYREPDGAAAWRTFLAGYGPLKAILAGLDPERQKRLERDFVAFHDSFRTPLGIAVPRAYLVTRGVRR